MPLQRIEKLFLPAGPIFRNFTRVLKIFDFNSVGKQVKRRQRRIK